MNWGGLQFRILEDGKLALVKSFDYDNTAREKQHPRMPFAQAELAGGATTGTIYMHGAEASSKLRYVSHEEQENALVIVQRSEEMEIVSRLVKYEDTNAIRITQTIRNISSEEICLESANTATLYFGNAVADNKDWYLHL